MCANYLFQRFVIFKANKQTKICKTNRYQYLNEISIQAVQITCKIFFDIIFAALFCKLQKYHYIFCYVNNFIFYLVRYILKKIKLEIELIHFSKNLFNIKCKRIRRIEVLFLTQNVFWYFYDSDIWRHKFIAFFAHIE